jgi:gluconolactonase
MIGRIPGTVRALAGTSWLCLVMSSAATAQVVERAAEVPTLTEGPTVDRDGNLYFTELRFRRIFKVDQKGELSVFRENSHGANGLLVDPQNRLIACEGATDGQPPRITRTDLRTGAIEVLADAFQGMPLKGTNDVTIDNKGRLYFTDPGAVAVYRIDGPGQIARVLAAPDILRPNGLQIAPDDKTLYVIESGDPPSGPRMIRAFDLAADGTAGNGRTLFDFAGRGGDGASVDVQGNLYVAAGLNYQPPPGALAGARAWPAESRKTKTGVYVISPAGKLLTFIPIPEDIISNTAFGGPDMKTLYVTSGKTVFKVRTEIAGLPR